MKPFRFGVGLRQARSRAEVVEKARRVEALGYDLLGVPDHLTDGLAAPLPVLVAAAGATQRLQLATNVLNNDLRHPVVLAREAATVDLLTDGRFQLGLGAGTNEAETGKRGWSSIRAARGWSGLARQSRSSGACSMENG